MAATASIGGVVFLRIDGVQYRLRGDVKVRYGNITRESVRGADNTDHGWIEKPMTPGFDMTLSDSGDLTMQQLSSVTSSTVTVELNNGKTFVGDNARQVGELELDAMEGKQPIKFDCSTMTEVPVTP